MKIKNTHLLPTFNPIYLAKLKNMCFLHMDKRELINIQRTIHLPIFLSFRTYLVPIQRLPVTCTLHNKLNGKLIYPPHTQLTILI